MTLHADATAAAGSGNGSRPTSRRTAYRQARLPDGPPVARDSRTASRRTDPHHGIDPEASAMTTLSVVSASTQLDAGGTTWRLRSLIAMGHDSSRIARAMNVRPEPIRELVRGDTATVSPRVPRPGLPAMERLVGQAPAGNQPAASARPPPPPGDGPNATAGPRPRAWTKTLLDEPGYRPFCRYRPAAGTGIAGDFRPAAQQPAAREIA